jgi:serine protease Do
MWKIGTNLIVVPILLLSTHLVQAHIPTSDKLDFSLSPTYGETKLAAGFLSDPFTTEVTSGGVVSGSYLPEQCTGWASEAPDFRLFWTGDTNELRIFFEAFDSSDDATLIINLPDGTWRCNDDASDSTLNPMVVFTNPAIGQYDIWVGSFSEGEYIAGNLSITELDLEPGNDTWLNESTGDLDFTADALFGVINLAAGFTPDPHTATATAGGSVHLSSSRASSAGCVGWASEAPDFKFHWTGTTADLSIFFTADDPDDDTVLVINTPDGQWICNDDAHGLTLNPQLKLSAFGAGRYDIWVGTYSQGEYVRGTLSITEWDIAVD